MEQDSPREVQPAEDEDRSRVSTQTLAAEESPAMLDFSPAAKVGFICTGVVLPTICFLAASSGFLAEEVDWQSGRFEDYCQLLMSFESCLPFYPFLLYPMVCMTCVVRQPRRYAKHFLIRLGVFTGMVLAVQYAFLFGCYTSGSGFLGSPLIGIFLWGCAWLVAWFASDHHPDGRPVFLTILTGFAVIILFFACIPPYCFILALACSTTWAIIAYSMMSWRLLRQRGREPWQFSLAQLMIFVTWLAAYLSAWRLSVNLMLVEYAKLPTTPPDDCYVCTAAARGHGWFVCSQTVRTDAGNIARVNDQMRYLKAAEITLAATCPRAHRPARAVYDRVGPPAARLLAHPLAADTAYLALKPAEWAARMFFAVALPDAARLARRLYLYR